MIHLEVAVAAPLNRTLTYSLPVDSGYQSMTGRQCIGKRVLVSLTGRRVTGYILSSMNEEKTEFVVKNIVKFLDERPLFHEKQIPFFRWISDYYHYPLGLVIKTALPQGLTPRSVRKIVLSRNHSQLSELCDVEHQSWVRNVLEKGALTVSETRRVVGNIETEKLVKKLIKEDVLRIEESVQVLEFRVSVAVPSRQCFLKKPEQFHCLFMFGDSD